jgi:Protein of unknown function (DUF4197)
MIKKFFTLFVFCGFLASCDILSQMGVPLTEADVANGLKEALIQGVNRGAGSLFNTQSNGNSGLLNELLPSDVSNALSLANSLGLSPKINQLTQTLNTAAVNSAQNSIPVFVNSIKGMGISDAWGILRGAQNAGTNYLRQTTGTGLVNAVRPEVNTVFSSLGLKPSLLQNLGTNNSMLKALDVDLTQLLSQLICNKMYNKIEQEEARIRTDISARSTGLLQRVFAAQTAPVQAR